MYGRGEGVSKNIIESVGWFRKAAMQRIVYAQHNLGYIYLIGEGVPKNIDESIRWLR
ncbi:MAG: sel1 repeat family protein, partial [Nitrospinae bacterium]|nr:sel1 repeat family protein [Nitrospinota bacterium]